MVIWNSLHLRSKIVIMLAPAMLPMLLIVFLTYTSARSASLESGENLSRLIVSSVSSELNGELAAQAAQFNEWIEEDIFGLSIEFDTTKELGEQFDAMLGSAPGFSMLVLTDTNGRVLLTSGSDGLEGQIASDALDVPDTAETTAFSCMFIFHQPDRLYNTVIRK